MTPAAVTVASVLGPVPVAVGARVDAHAHTWIDSDPRARAAGLPHLVEAAQVTGELSQFRADGGGALIDCQPPLCGRDLEHLRAHQRASGVAIVACTGFHMPQWYPDGSLPWTGSVDECHALFCAEIRDGLVGAVKAAHLGAATDDRASALMDAAARAAHAGGVPLVIHTERGVEVEQLVALLEDTGIAPEAVLLCHIDKRPDLGLHVALAEAGYRLEYDTFVRPQYAPETGVWPLIEAMVARGWADSICIGLDLADPSLWQFAGGPGMRALTHDIPRGLEWMGVDADDITALCGGNAQNLLALCSRQAA